MGIEKILGEESRQGVVEALLSELCKLQSEEPAQTLSKETRKVVSTVTFGEL